MGISVNGPSGIDTQSLITQLVSLEQQKVTKVQVERDSYNTMTTAYTQLKSYVSDVVSKASALKSEDGFNVFSNTVSNAEVVGMTAGTGSVEGSYGLRVFQIAQTEKLISSDKKVTDQTAALSTMGITTGTITINGTDIALGATDSLQDVRMKINNARTATGAKIGVTATVLKVSDNNFRLVLTNSEPGKTGMTLKDTLGTMLQDMGIVKDASGGKGIANQVLESQTDIAAAFAGLAVGQTIEYAGKDRQGKDISAVFVKTASSTIDDLTTDIAHTFRGMATVAIADTLAGGKLTITDTVGGATSMQLSSFKVGVAAQAIDIKTAGFAGQNILTMGQDAFFSVDEIMMTSTKNSTTGSIAGVTLELKKASTDVVKIEMKRDLTAVTKKVSDMLNSYNAVLRFVNKETKWGDSSKGESSGKLKGDMTARSIVQQVRSGLQQQYNTNGGSDLTSLTMLGVKTNTGTGEFEIDETKFKALLTERFEEVVGFFTTRGWSDKGNVTMGRYTKETQEGVYSLSETDADHYTIQRTNPAGTGTLSSMRADKIVSFTSGDANGLSMTIPLGTGAAAFTFSRGLAGSLEMALDKITNTSTGVVKMRQDSFASTMKRFDARIISMNARVDSYQSRLVTEFSNMEKNLQNLKSQQSNMMSQLGYSS